jgi:pentatricopeptide repeat protein
MLDIVLMGASKAGRTSMAKVIFQKMVTKQTQLLSETTKV